MVEEKGCSQKGEASNSMALGIGVGTSIGVSLGVALDNLALGIAIGLSLGAAMGATGVFGGSESAKCGSSSTENESE
ncbi:MAG: hypothetical protein ACE361_00025 [Aureliella sp.]